MTDLFRNPARDASAEAPYATPSDDIPDGPMGAEEALPLTPGSSQRKKLAIGLAAAGVLTLGLVLVVSFRKGDAPVAKSNGSKDAMKAAIPHAGPSSSALSLDSAARAQAQTTGADGAVDFAVPGASHEPTGTVSAPVPAPTKGAQVTTFDPTKVAGRTPEAASNPYGGFPAPSAEPTATRPAANGDGHGRFDAPVDSATTEGREQRRAEQRAEREAARQAALQQQKEREALVEQRKQALAAAIAAEEARMKAPTLLVAGEGALLARSTGAGASRFGGATAGTPASAGSGNDDPTLPRSARAGLDGRGSGDDRVLPGTRVEGLTVTEFRSDATDGGIEIRLSAAVRDKDKKVLLPAGTRGFGSVSATGGTAGQPARVTITVATWLKPNSEVVRGLSAVAGDPKTLSNSVPASVDQHYLDRGARLLASSAIGIVMTQNAQDRPSAFQAPSQRDLAMQDIRTKTQAIISDRVGNEQTDKPTVVLAPNTKIMLMFGTTGGM